MSKFSYRALAGDGKTKSGEVAADSLAAAASYLTNNGLTPLSVRPSSLLSRGLGLLLSDLGSGKSLALKQQTILAKALATLLEAGIDVNQGLSILEEAGESKPLREATAAIGRHLRRGHALSEAITMSGIKLEPVFSGLIAAGQQSGKLAACLMAASEALDQKAANSRKIRSALAYPVILCIGALASIFILFTQALPRLRTLFTDAGAEPPWLTGLMFGASDFAVAIGPFLALGLVVAISTIPFVWKIRRFRLMIEHCILSLPLIGGVMKRSEAALFCRMMSILTSAAYVTSEALERCAHSLSSLTYSEFARQAAVRVRAGETLATLMGEAGAIFPGAVAPLVIIGDKSSRLSTILHQSALILEDELEARQSLMITLITPIFLIVLGGIVLALVMAIWTTVLSLNDVVL